MKEKMWKMFSARNSWEYLDELKNLIWDYNHTKHRSIGMTPVKASKKKTKRKCLKNSMETPFQRKRNPNSPLERKSEFPKRKELSKKVSNHIGQKKSLWWTNQLHFPSGL